MADRPVNVLSLCSGAGGLDRGVRMAVPAARTVCYVEIEAYAAEVLACRMEEGRMDPAPLWSDLRTFDGRPWRGAVDLVVGGYPCQPFSVAGARRGADDPRHLWPHVARILRECAAPVAFFENVSGHVSLGLRQVRSELEGMGYCVEAEIVRAEEIGAPHRRERVFILAYTDEGRSRVGQADPDRERVGDSDQLRRRSGASGTGAANACGGGSLLADAESSRFGAGNVWQERTRRTEPARGCESMGDPDSARLEGRGVRGCERADEWVTGARGSAVEHADGQGQREHSRLVGHERRLSRDAGEAFWPPRPDDWSAWENWHGPQPAIRGDVDGVASGLVSRVDELRLCGGGVVPQQAAYAFELMRERVMAGRAGKR